MSEETIYSWSRLNTFHMAETGDGCFHCFNLIYNEGDRGEGNYFSEYGTLFHETTEKLLKSEISVFDIDNELEQGLKSLNYYPPFPNMGKSYKAAIFKFFQEFYHDLFAKYEILESEEEKLFEVEGYLMRGFPDLVANHTDYGFVVGDYKTSKPYTGAKLKNNIQQLYLYSIPIYEKYGRYPDNLVYIYPREKEKIEYVYPFEMEELERTKQFVTDTIQKIQQHKEWEPRCTSVDPFKDFYACNLCNHRRTCEYRVQKL